VPVLYGGQIAELFWQEVSGAAGYILECSLDEPFEQASRGRHWDSLDALGKTWNEIDNQLSWDAFEALPAVGRNFDQWDWLNMSWNELDTLSLSWDDIEQIPFSFVVYQGPGEPVTEEPASPGFTWNDVDARCLTWSELESYELTWNDFEQLPADEGPHRGWEIRIPEERRSLWVRVCAYDANGNRSDYIETSERPIFHVRTESVHAVEDDVCYVQTDCDNIHSFDNWVFTLQYNQNTLLFDSIATTPHGFDEPCSMPWLISYYGGALTIKNMRSIGFGKQWDGVHARTYFVTEQTADTPVELVSHHLTQEKKANKEYRKSHSHTTE